MRHGTKGPLTAEEFKAKLAKIHAEGAARVRAILASEGYVANARAPVKPSAAHVRAKQRHAVAQFRMRAGQERALADGALFVTRLDVRTENHANAHTGSSRLALSRTKARQRSITRQVFGCVLDAATARKSPLPCRVLLRRVAPSSGLDPHDGLPGALKAVVDGIADALGLASDRDPRVTWTYDQRRGVAGEYAVEVEVWRA